MIFLKLLTVLATPAGATQACLFSYLGDGVCDRACMNPSFSFDSLKGGPSDCAYACSTHCPVDQLGNNICDSECDTWDCAWDHGDCLLCDGSCLVANLGNDVCDSECDSWVCGWDAGDCSGSDNPVQVYVGTGTEQGDGSREAPFSDLTETIMQLFLPYNTIVMLAGTYSLNPLGLRLSPLLAYRGLVQTVIIGENCEGAGCKFAEVELADFVEFALGHNATFANIRFHGHYALHPGCNAATCEYCPYTIFNESEGYWVNDRNEEIDISQYAMRGDCDQYHEKAFITVTEGALVLFSNVTFERFEQQLKALILNQCGDIRFDNVTFDGNMANPIGLKGGLIQHVCPSAHLPYDCGSIVFEGGNVIYLNDGYEYRPDILFTGFMNIQGIRLLRISNVYFGFSFAMIGYDVDIDLQIHSALIYVTNFREMEVAFCTFEFGIAEISAAIYIDSNLVFPLIVENGEATEQNLTHLIIRDTNFYNNTSQRGSLLYLSFKGDNINIRLERLTFASNIALLGIVYVKCQRINKEDFEGLSKLSNGVSVFYPKRSMVIDQIHAVDNLSETLFSLTNIANFQLTSSVFLRNGESPTGVTSFSDILSNFLRVGRVYADIQPSFSVPLQCTEIISLTNVLRLVFLYNELNGSYCPSGVSGLSLAGDVRLMTVHDNYFINGSGSGALTLAVSQPVILSNLTFKNNANLENKNSVCLDIRMKTATDVSIFDSVFEGNTGWFSTVIYAENTQSLTLTRVSLTRNTALYICSGVLFSPYPSGPSTLQITDSEFVNNSANSHGVVTVMDSDGLLSGNTVSTVQLLFTNLTFSENLSQVEGAAITISTAVSLSESSFVSDSTFSRNECEAGPAIHASFERGVFTVRHCSFLDNSGDSGSAVFLHHMFPKDRQTRVEIVECFFAGQTGSPAVVVEGYSRNNEVTAGGNTFTDGQGAYSVMSCDFNDSGSVYSGQRTISGAGMLVEILSNVRCWNVTARNNTATSKGGAFFVMDRSLLVLENSDLDSNSAGDSGGAIYSSGDSYIQIIDSLVHDNTAEQFASAIFVSPGTLLIDGSRFYQNSAGRYGVFVLTHSSATIIAADFRDNSSSEDSPGIVLSSCDVSIEKSLFSDQQGLTGAFLLAIDHNSVRLTDSEFRNGTAKFQGGAVFGTLQSDFDISNCLFDGCTSEDEGGALQLSSCSLTISNSSFLRTHSVVNGGAIYIREGYAYIDSCYFFECYPGALQVFGIEEMKLTNSWFLNGGNDRGGAIELDNVISTLFENNRFENNTAGQAGAIWLYCDGTDGEPDTHVFLNNVFLANTASDQNAGAIVSSNANLHLDGNNFTHNRATAAESSGGAVVTYCQLFAWCNVTITNNYFLGNQAEWAGGAAMWVDSFPQFAGNRFIGNTAKYALEIASFPVQLALVSPVNTQQPYIGFHAGLPVVRTILGVASGQLVPGTLLFGLFDHNQQLVTTEQVSSASIEAYNASLVRVNGELDTKAADGQFEFSDFAAVGEVETTQYIIVVTNGIDMDLKERAKDAVDYYPAVLVELVFRKCQSGESLQSKECYRCSEGTYSLDPALPCLQCPSAAVCYGNDTMVPKPGYWRIRNDTDMFIECLAPEACIGSPDPPFLSLTGKCALGYEGNLCHGCIEGYSRTGRFQCSICPSKASNIAVTALIVILALILIALIVWTAINSAMKPQSLIAIYVKIFMNYLQMVVVSAALNLNWPTFVKTFLNGQQMAGGMAEQLFSFECLIRSSHVSSNEFFYVRVQVYAALAPTLLLLAALVWFLRSVCVKSEHIFRKIISSSVIILFILHPSITSIMFSLFACMDLGDGQTWLMKDLSIVCWNSEHLKQILTVVVPSLIVFVFGLPLLCLLFLIVNRRLLETPNIKLMLCFLYKGYHRQRFYWEFVILYRKVAMIAASVFLARVSIRVQSLTVFAVLLLSLFLQVMIIPFFDVSLNQLEIKSILTSAITIYSGLYYDTNNLDTVLEIILFCVIILTNAYFLATWLRLISPVLLLTIKEKFARIARWRRKYRVRDTNMSVSIPEHADKTPVSAAMFSSDISRNEMSQSLDLSRRGPTYLDPANTSIAQREMTEPRPHDLEQYTFVD